jgi:hypothetical protein
MSSEPIRLTDLDDGWFDVELPGGEMRRLDLWDVFNRLLEMEARTKERPTYDRNQAVCDLMENALGLPRVSQKTAAWFLERFYERMNGVKKKPETPPDSPPPTAPPSSASPGASSSDST